MSRLHLLDTNALRSWIDGGDERHDSAVARVKELGDGFVFLSSVTVGEVEFGLARPHGLTDQLVQDIRAALRRFPVLPIDQHVAEPYGKLRAWLLERYGPKDRRRAARSLSQLLDPATDLELGVQENDLWLASQSIATDAVLVSLRQDAAAGRGSDRHTSGAPNRFVVNAASRLIRPRRRFCDIEEPRAAASSGCRRA